MDEKKVFIPSNKLSDQIYNDWNRYDASGDVPVNDISDNNLKDYMSNVFMAVERGKKDIDDNQFFIVVTLRGEPMVSKALRNQFFFRRSCPTPTFQQTVFRYLRKDDMLEYLWSMPDVETSYFYKHNPTMVLPSKYGILQHVLDYFDGKLDEICLTLNKEDKKPDYLNNK